MIKEQPSKGIIDILDEKHLPTKKHYIPNHAVMNANKSTKNIRIVYDASVKKNNSTRSLNECLNRGPFILEDIYTLLLRFRTTRIGIVADIEKFFLQVGLQEPDWDVTRFLWIKNIKAEENNNNHETYRFTRIPLGIISSSFFLENTIYHHLRKYNLPIALKIKNDIYVDNRLRRRWDKSLHRIKTNF